MNLLDLLKSQMPQSASYTNKAPLELLDGALPIGNSKMLGIIRDNDGTMHMPMKSNDNYLSEVNKAFDMVSPAAKKLKQPDQPTGFLNLINLLKNGVVYRNDW